MTPLDFVLWLNGVLDATGDDQPTAAQMAKIKEKLAETVGPIIASKLLDRADQFAREEERTNMTQTQPLDLMRLKYEEYARMYARRAAFPGYGANAIYATATTNTKGTL